MTDLQAGLKKKKKNFAEKIIMAVIIKVVTLVLGHLAPSRLDTSWAGGVSPLTL